MRTISLIKISSIAILLLITIVSCKSVKNNQKKIIDDSIIMKLEGKLQIVDENFIKFILTATRKKLIENEYMPNSENFRIEIFDDEMNLIFNSDFEHHFLMVISDVKPVKIGETEEYQHLWNMKGNDGKRIKKGKYTANLIIPAMPNVYTTSVEFEIK